MILSQSPQEGRERPTMRSKEPTIPLSAVEMILKMHQRHCEEITSVIGNHLEKAAALYERALNPPVATGPISPMFISEVEEDDKYASLAAEMESIRDLALEKGLDLGDLRIE